VRRRGKGQGGSRQWAVRHQRRRKQAARGGGEQGTRLSDVFPWPSSPSGRRGGAAQVTRRPRQAVVAPKPRLSQHAKCLLHALLASRQARRHSSLAQRSHETFGTVHGRDVAWQVSEKRKARAMGPQLRPPGRSGMLLAMTPRLLCQSRRRGAGRRGWDSGPLLGPSPAPLRVAAGPAPALLRPRRRARPQQWSAAHPLVRQPRWGGARTR
jgi:hypothetical protein